MEGLPGAGQLNTPYTANSRDADSRLPRPQYWLTQVAQMRH